MWFKQVFPLNEVHLLVYHTILWPTVFFFLLFMSVMAPETKQGISVMLLFPLSVDVILTQQICR